jgi:hypothetical protein
VVNVRRAPYKARCFTVREGIFMKFEYKHFSPEGMRQVNKVHEWHMGGNVFKKPDDALNTFGADGWELVGFSHEIDVNGDMSMGDGNISSDIKPVYVFKRLCK